MATIKTDGSGQLIKKLVNPIQAQIMRMLPEIQKALPGKMLSRDRFVRLMATALKTVPHLSECEPASFWGCILTAAQLDLEPNTPLQQFALIPRRRREQDGGGYYCSYIIPYPGKLDLIVRSGQVSVDVPVPVFKSDYFQYEQGLNPILIHRPDFVADRENFDDLMGVYVIYQIRDYPRRAVYLPRQEILRRRNRSVAYAAGKTSPWHTDAIAMAMKSAIHYLFNYLPHSVVDGRFLTAIKVEEKMEMNGSVAFDPDVSEILIERGVAVEADADRVTDGVEDTAAQEVGEEERLAAERGTVKRKTKAATKSTAKSPVSESENMARFRSILARISSLLPDTTEAHILAQVTGGLEGWSYIGERDLERYIARAEEYLADIKTKADEGSDRLPWASAADSDAGGQANDESNDENNDESNDGNNDENLDF